MKCDDNEKIIFETERDGFPGYNADIWADSQRFCVAGIRAGQKGRLQGVASARNFYAFLLRKASCLYAVCLRTPNVLRKNRGRNERLRRFSAFDLPVYRFGKESRAYRGRNDKN